MPPKRKQKTRLNPSVDFARISLNRNSKVDKKSIDTSFSEYDNEDLDMEEEIDKVEVVLSRTSYLILDYLQFKAARSIQRFVRGWLYRTKYQRKRKAAIKIQAHWRRFYCQRMYFCKLEQTLQQRIEAHYYRSAQKIQSLWRGWYSRQYIHDHTYLITMQGLAAEELLYCVAFKLHHLIRTHQIPGIYSLRNSTAFSKVEQLLATLSVKNCNEHAHAVKDYRENAINYAKKRFKKSKYGTEIPFSGPNINNICVSKCMPLFSAKDADRRMARILKIYKNADQQKFRPILSKHKSKYSKLYHDKSAATTFCGDVVRSMKKWNIIKEHNLKVENDIFEKPENVENFIKEIESKLSFMHDNCYCGQEYLNKPTPENQSKKNSLSLYTYSCNDAKLTNSLTSGIKPNEECSYFDNQKVTRNSLPTSVTENARTTENVRNLGTGVNHSKSKGSSRNSVPTKVCGNTEDARNHYSSDQPRKSITFEKVPILRNSIGK